MKIAIYSRKSKFTDKGDSIENQIEMCKEYAEKHFKTELEYLIYEDEGFSGKDTNRSRFQDMLRDAKERKFNSLICYRLDRVSRNIADFSSLIEELQKHNISFISIKEQFDTTTPLGRAMMFIASVFAQLERETIAERIRDNMRELAKTGRWLGGAPPLGFELERISFINNDFKERTLVKLNPLKEEMKEVKYLYTKYLELGSIHQLRKFLIRNKYKTKRNAYFSLRVLSDILRNPAYVRANQSVVKYLEDKGIMVAGQDRINGKIAILIYNKRKSKGPKNDFNEWIGALAKHEGSISAEKWLKVQQQLDKNSMKLPRVGTSYVALLSGIIRCSKCGSAMNVTYGRKKKDGTSHHYYTCSLKAISSGEKCQNPNANGSDIDNTVITKLTELATSNKEILLEELEAIKKENRGSNKINFLDELKNKKKRLLEEINNLVGEISKSATASKYIIPQIESKDQEIKALKDEIAKLEKEAEKKKKSFEELDLVINNILNFNSVITKLSNKEKKYFLQTIIDKVYWDGEAGKVAIKLLTESDKGKLNCSNNSNMSQFHPASSGTGY